MTNFINGLQPTPGRKFPGSLFNSSPQSPQQRFGIKQPSKTTEHAYQLTYRGMFPSSIHCTIRTLVIKFDNICQAETVEWFHFETCVLIFIHYRSKVLKLTVQSVGCVNARCQELKMPNNRQYASVASTRDILAVPPIAKHVAAEVVPACDTCSARLTVVGRPVARSPGRPVDATECLYGRLSPVPYHNASLQGCLDWTVYVNM